MPRQVSGWWGGLGGQAVVSAFVCSVRPELSSQKLLAPGWLLCGTFEELGRAVDLRLTLALVVTGRSWMGFCGDRLVCSRGLVGFHGAEQVEQSR